MKLLNLRSNIIEQIVFEKKACLVGSSGILLGKNKGSEIDQFNGSVVRMNGACVGGKYDKDVGNNCDIRVVCYNAIEQIWKLKNELGLHGNKSDGIVIFWGADVHKRKAWNIVGQLCKVFGNIRFYEIGQQNVKDYDQLFFKYTGVPRLASGAWLSTGWITLCLLLSNGCEVSVYGMFGGGNDMYHYWDTSRGREDGHYKEQQFGTRGHRFLTEHNVFVDIWTKIYKLKFIKL